MRSRFDNLVLFLLLFFPFVVVTSWKKSRQRGDNQKDGGDEEAANDLYAGIYAGVSSGSLLKLARIKSLHSNLIEDVDGACEASFDDDALVQAAKQVLLPLE